MKTRPIWVLLGLLMAIGLSVPSALWWRANSTAGKYEIQFTDISGDMLGHGIVEMRVTAVKWSMSDTVPFVACVATGSEVNSTFDLVGSAKRNLDIDPTSPHRFEFCYATAQGFLWAYDFSDTRISMYVHHTGNKTFSGKIWRVLSRNSEELGIATIKRL